MKTKLLILLFFACTAALSWADSDDLYPFVLPEAVFQARSTLEERVTFSMKADADYLLNNSTLLSAMLDFEVDANHTGFSYGAAYGIIFDGKSGSEDVLGAFFGMDDSYSYYSKMSGTASYNKMHILELGLTGRQLDYSDMYMDWAGYSIAVITDENSHEFYAFAGYRYLALHNTLFPVFQDISFSVRGLAGFYIFSREVTEDGAVTESIPSSMVFSWGAVAEIKYYLFTAEIGYLNNSIYWSAGMRIPFSLFLQ